MTNGSIHSGREAILTNPVCDSRVFLKFVVDLVNFLLHLLNMMSNEF